MLSDDDKQALKREVDQMFVNLHQLLRGDEPDCPDCGFAEKVRVGAHNITHMIEHSPPNEPDNYIGSNARWLMHVKPILRTAENIKSILAEAEEHATDNGVLLPHQTFDRLMDDAGRMVEDMEDAIGESEYGGEDDCDTGAESDF